MNHVIHWILKSVSFNVVETGGIFGVHGVVQECVLWLCVCYQVVGVAEGFRMVSFSTVGETNSLTN